MRKALFILFFVFLFFLIEFYLFNTLGAWLTPNMLLLLVVFFTLSLGVRYGIFTAIVAGLLKDSFSIHFLGVHVLAFMACAYTAVLVRRYFFNSMTDLTRLFIVFWVCFINWIFQYMLYMKSHSISLWHATGYVFIPETLATLLAAIFVFNRLRQCALKLSV